MMAAAIALVGGFYHFFLAETWDPQGLAQIADVFHTHAGKQASIDEVSRRAGSWLDPELCAAFATVAADDRFWSDLASPMLDARLLTMAPSGQSVIVDDDYLRLCWQ